MSRPQRRRKPEAADSETLGPSAEMPDSGSADAPQSIRLPEILDLTAATPLTAALVALRGASLVIDASQVTRLGAQCLQVLLSAVATWEMDEVQIDVDAPSTAFLDGLDLFGVPAASLKTIGAPQ